MTLTPERRTARTAVLPVPIITNRRQASARPSRAPSITSTSPTVGSSKFPGSVDSDSPEPPSPFEDMRYHRRHASSLHSISDLAAEPNSLSSDSMSAFFDALHDRSPRSPARRGRRAERRSPDRVVKSRRVDTELDRHAGQLKEKLKALKSTPEPSATNSGESQPSSASSGGSSASPSLPSSAPHTTPSIEYSLRQTSFSQLHELAAQSISEESPAEVAASPAVPSSTTSRVDYCTTTAGSSF